MKQFLWEVHITETKYPESTFKMQLGNSYMATSAPVAPDQRTFTLSFSTMRYFMLPEGGVDVAPNVALNFGALEAFYNEHKLFKSFTYKHPVYGNVTCKFNKALDVPKPKNNGGGWLEPFTLEFIEIP